MDVLPANSPASLALSGGRSLNHEVLKLPPGLLKIHHTPCLTSQYQHRVHSTITQGLGLDNAQAEASTTHPKVHALCDGICLGNNADRVSSRERNTSHPVVHVHSIRLDGGDKLTLLQAAANGEPYRPLADCWQAIRQHLLQEIDHLLSEDDLESEA